MMKTDRTKTRSLKHIALMSCAVGMCLLAACSDATIDTAPAPPADAWPGPMVAPEPSFRSAPKAASEYFDGEPGAGVTFINYPASRSGDNDRGSAVLKDILDHLPTSYGNQYYDEDPITHGHETTHGINSDVRNYHNNTGGDANGFYVLQDRAVLIVEPGIRKSDANVFVPANLRGSRYDLYLAGSQAWDDTPTYLMDEWVSYVNGGEVGVDMVNNNLWNREWRDGVAGQLEFNVYVLALAMAVEAGDPEYFQNNTQFLEFLAWNLERSMRIYFEGAQMEAFRWDRQDNYFAAFKDSAEADDMRSFAYRIFGDAWTRRVLFGEDVPNDDTPVDPGNGGDNGNDDNPDNPGGGNPDVDPDLDNPDVNPGGGDVNGGEDNPDGIAPPEDDGNDIGGIGPPSDSDGDGIANHDDACSNTPAGRPIWRSGEWLGCAHGQFRDPDLGEGPDADRDKIPDTHDLCSATPEGRPVWTSGEWLGCAGGQVRDLDRGPANDRDLDGVADNQDLCNSTPNGSPVWREGNWLGCAFGEVRDR